MKNGKLFIKAWILVGLLDLLAAFISFYLSTGKSPLIVLKFIASAVLGQSAYTPESGSIWIGLLLHFTIAFLFTAFFFLLYKPLRLFKVQWVFLGVIYGLVIWLVMNKLVLPLTLVKQQPFNWMDAARAVLILITMIGLPLSWMLKKAGKQPLAFSN